MSALELVALVLLGGFTGALGGMLGVGGSTILIPGLTLLLGPDQHLYQAAAMIANVAVAVPATLRHRRAGVLNPAVLRGMLPMALLGVIGGVAVSNLGVFSGDAGGLWLRRMLSVFLVYVMAVNVQKLVRPAPAQPVASAPDAPRGWRLSAGAGAVGAAMGGIAGLLGIGGGALAVPMQQTLLRQRLPAAIGNSAAVMCFSAAVGAVYKNATLPAHGSAADPLHWWSGLLIAAAVCPSAWLGGRVGAGLTHRLPLRAVRAVFVVVLGLAAWRMWG